MALEVNIHEAKTNLSKLLARVIAGEEVIITRAGTPVARLVPINEMKKPRRLGGAAGKIYIASDFNDPLPEDVLAEFEK
jgi:prevent-host-death family protein